MARKARPKEPPKTQKERFIETARQLKADESGKAFEEAFKKIAPAKHQVKKS